MDFINSEYCIFMSLPCINESKLSMILTLNEITLNMIVGVDI